MISLNTENRDVSSANSFAFVDKLPRKSLLQINSSNGPSTEF